MIKLDKYSLEINMLIYQKKNKNKYALYVEISLTSFNDFRLI